MNFGRSPLLAVDLVSKPPLRGALVIGAASAGALAQRTQQFQHTLATSLAPARMAPAEADLRAPERLAIDYDDTTDLSSKLAKALKALDTDHPAMWKVLRAQGIFRGRGPAPKVAFLYTGQGSQYVNMLRTLRASEPIVDETFREADRVMAPLLGRPLSELIFIDDTDPENLAEADKKLAPTAITRTGSRYRYYSAISGLRDRTRHGDGAQPGRIRCTDRLRRSFLYRRFANC